MSASKASSTTAVTMLTRPKGANKVWVAIKSFVLRKPLGTVSAAFLLVMAFSAIFANLISPYGPYQVAPIESFNPPSLKHFFGTDQIGRDVFSRVIFGSRISMQVGFMAVGIGLTAAVLVGILSGYIGGVFDTIVQRISDAIQTIPGIVLAMALVSVLGASLTNVMLAISFVIIPTNQRVVRSAVLTTRENMYVEAARAIGASPARVMIRHILPNVVAPIIVLASLLFGFAILTEAGLSFLGLGTPPPTPSWGMMLSGDGRLFMESAPWLSIFPGLAITLAVLAFNLFGDSLRDVLDPRLRGT